VDHLVRLGATCRLRAHAVHRTASGRGARTRRADAGEDDLGSAPGAWSPSEHGILCPVVSRGVSDGQRGKMLNAEVNGVTSISGSQRGFQGSSP
jgi:hypothetical protein